MKTSYLLCLVVLVGTSCSLFERTAKNNSESSHKTSTSLEMNNAGYTNTVKHTEQMQMQNDTVLADYTILLWPKGNLTFQPSGGFSGEFDSVQLKGKLKMLSNSSASVRTDEQKNKIKRGNLRADQNENFSSKAVLKTNSIDIKMMFFAALVLLAGLLFWLKEWNFNRR